MRTSCSLIPFNCLSLVTTQSPGHLPCGGDEEETGFLNLDSCDFLGETGGDGSNVRLERRCITPIRRLHELQFILLDRPFQKPEAAAEHHDLSHGENDEQLFGRCVHILFQRRIGSQLGVKELRVGQLIAVLIVSEHVERGYGRIVAKARIVTRARRGCCDGIGIGVHKMFRGFVRGPDGANEMVQCVGGTVSGSDNHAAKCAEGSLVDEYEE